MPFPTEHAARQRDPGDFDPKSFRRVNGKFGAGVDVIFGKLKGGKGTLVIQTIRFDAKKFTPEQARQWLKDHKYATTLEPATAPTAAKKETTLKHLTGQHAQKRHGLRGSQTPDTAEAREGRRQAGQAVIDKMNTVAKRSQQPDLSQSERNALRTEYTRLQGEYNQAALPKGSPSAASAPRKAGSPIRPARTLEQVHRERRAAQEELTRISRKYGGTRKSPSKADQEQIDYLNQRITRLDQERTRLANPASKELKETVTKSEQDGPHPSSHYLVVEDPQKPTTWHLRFRNRSGEVDRGLLGAAWAALHKGFRGNVYSGPGKQEAIGRLTKLYHSEGLKTPGESTAAKKELTAAIALRVGAPFHSYQPLQAVAFTVTATKEGKPRWTLFSSSAFRDRDGEIVSTKALQADVDRADHDHDYGPLRWWHVDGVDLGDCDFNMLHRHILIESGTFRSPETAAAVKEHADELEASIGFVHPSVEPDRDGIYYRIRRFERSLVPKGRVSNRTTRLIL